MAKSIEDLSTKFLLTFEESSRYFGIGENKLRNMASYGDTPDWVVHNGKTYPLLPYPTQDLSSINAVRSYLSSNGSFLSQSI